MTSCPACGRRKLSGDRVCPHCAYDDEPLGPAVSHGRAGPFDIEQTLAGFDRLARKRLRKLGYPWDWRRREPIPNDEERRSGLAATVESWEAAGTGPTSPGWTAPTNHAGSRGPAVLLVDDGEEPRLGLRLVRGEPSVFVLDVEAAAGEDHRFTIGAFPVFSIEAARGRARKLLATFPDGYPQPTAVETASEQELCDAAMDALESYDSAPDVAEWWRCVQDALNLLREIDNGRKVPNLPYGPARDRWWFSVGARLLETANRARIREDIEQDLLRWRRRDKKNRKNLVEGRRKYSDRDREAMAKAVSEKMRRRPGLSTTRAAELVAKEIRASTSTVQRAVKEFSVMSLD